MKPLARPDHQSLTVTGTVDLLELHNFTGRVPSPKMEAGSRYPSNTGMEASDFQPVYRAGIP
jgi:hypothetical protein